MGINTSHMPILLANAYSAPYRSVYLLHEPDEGQIILALLSHWERHVSVDCVHGAIMCTDSIDLYQ